MFKGNKNTRMQSNVIRGAIVARVSTDEQADNNSLETQVVGCLSMADRFGIDVPEEHIFRDDISGDTLDRPQLNRLRAKIKRGEIDAIIIHSSDRLARKPLVGEILFEEFVDYGVRLFIVLHGREFDLNNASDRQMLLMEMGFNRTWKAMLGEAMTRGKKGKAAKGKYIGYSKDGPFGYRLDGNGGLVPVDDEAVIIQNVYYWYVIEKVGISEILRRLRGTPTPAERNSKDYAHQKHAMTKAGTWRDTAVYRILRNPLYKGELTQLNEYVMKVPAIVDEEIYEAAQARLDKGKQKSFRGAKYDYLMRNRLRCSCGHVITTQPMTRTLKSGERKTIYYYECQSRKKDRPNAESCPLPRYMNRDLVDDVVWGYFVELIKQPQIIIQRLQEAKQETDERNRGIQQRIDALNALKAKQASKVDLLVEQFAGSKNTEVKAIFQRLRDETESLFNEVNAELDILEPQLQTGISDDFIKQWNSYAKYLRKRVDNATFQEKAEALEALNISGELTIEGEWLVAYVRVFKHTERLEVTVISQKRSSSTKAFSQIPTDSVILRIPICLTCNIHSRR